MWLVLGLLILAASAIAEPLEGVRELGSQRIERVQIDRAEVSSDGEAVVAVTLRVLAPDGEPVADLRPIDFRVWESDEPIEPSEFAVSSLARDGGHIATVMAIDSSRRSLGGAFESAISAAISLVERSGPDEDVAIVVFSDTVDLAVPFGTPAREARRRLESLHVDALAAGGLLFEGVLSGIDLIRTRVGATGRGFVIVSSSGIDRGSTRGLDRVASAIVGREGEPKIPVFTVAHEGASPEGVAVLRQLAESSGADLMLSSGSSFGALVGTIWRQMTRGYRLSFPTDFDGRRHRIDVEIEGQMASIKLAYPKPEESRFIYFAVAALALAVFGVAAYALLGLRSGKSARLVVLTGAHAGNVIKLPPGRYRIGSLAENDVVLESAGVSRYHAEIVVDDNGTRLHDLQSKNGSLVNGVARETSPLLPGDRVDFAEIRMVYECGRATSRRKTPAQ